jgi:hypothetical protein
MKTTLPGWLPDTGAESEALIKEARRRQHRRYLLTGLAIVVLAGAAGLTVSQVGPGGQPPAHQGRRHPDAQGGKIAPYHRTVTGILVRVGGPPPGSPVPLPGKVEARNDAGEVFTAATGNNGRFQLSLPPGTYQLTGHSPHVLANGRRGLCTAERTLYVTKNKTVRNIQVVCSIS